MQSVAGGRQNFKEGTQLSRSDLLIGGTATLAAVALPALTVAASTKIATSPSPTGRKGDNS